MLKLLVLVVISMLFLSNWAYANDLEPYTDEEYEALPEMTTIIVPLEDIVGGEYGEKEEENIPIINK